VNNNESYSIFRATWIHFLWCGKIFLVDVQNILSHGQGFDMKIQLFSYTRTHFGFCDLLYDYVLVLKYIYN
jgi:hypothetical protein